MSKHDYVSFIVLLIRGFDSDLRFMRDSDFRIMLINCLLIIDGSFDDSGTM